MGKLWRWLRDHGDVVLKAGDLLFALGVAIRESLRIDRPRT